MSDCMITVANVKKDFGGNPVFNEINLEVLDDQRIGLVGENGSGKSTLFQLMVGLDTPTGGTITRRRNLVIGYLAQEADPRMEQHTIFEAVAQSSPELAALSGRLSALEAQMADPEIAADAERMTQVLASYSKAQERFEALGGYTLEHRVEVVLSGLGFAATELHQSVGVLSGGEKKLVNLARILLQQPDVLLLDEPDNHLDLLAKIWLEDYIRDYPGAVIIISHDRRLLDRAINKIV
ncbi:MAG: ATP-binding cassette domain-containing protein [Ktedonobacteraceae bacterium]